jgi:DNA invertase Pin-like site-specific DNA recombinase
VTARSVGCARCSTTHQNIDAQIAALKATGCAVIFQGTICTRTTEKDRPQLQAALNALAEGDELVVAKLDRLGRDQRSVINRLQDLQDRGIHIRTLDNLFDSAPSSGVTQEALGPFLEGEQDQSWNDCLHADCSAPSTYYKTLSLNVQISD